MFSQTFPDEDEDDERSLGRLFQSAYNLSPADGANGAACSVAYVGSASASGSQAMDRNLSVSLDLDNDPLSRLFAESDHDEDEDDLGLDDSFARAVAGTEL